MPGGRSGIMARFVEECQKRGLPLNVGKSVIGDFSGIILGGELDGVRGNLRRSRDKGQRLVARSLALVCQEDSSLVMLRHWAGIFCFASSFRRNLFAIGQEIFKHIALLDASKIKWARTPEDLVDEILAGAILAPLASTNLCARIRPFISMSDASEQCGSAAEARQFAPELDRKMETSWMQLR